MQYAAINQQVNQAAAPVVQREKLKDQIGKAASAVASNLYSWQWTKSLAYWLVVSAGTASELAFLFASLWMSVNANVHDFILKYMSEDQATYLTYLATTAYVALPIFIVGLALVTTINHIKMWKTGGFWSVIWSILFGVPAVTFLVMDIVTLGCSVASVNFTMPTFFVVLRAESAFVFAFSSLLYHFLGRPQEHERLAKKDTIIANLRAEMVGSLAALTAEKDRIIADLTDEQVKIINHAAHEKDRIIADLTAEQVKIINHAAHEKESLVSTIDAKNDEIESLKGLLAQTQKGFTELHKAMNKAEDDALQAYGEECIAWLKSGIKSADVPTITRYTGLTTAKVNNALRRGDLKVTPNNKDLITIVSLVSWLKSLAVSERKTDPNMPVLQLVNSR